MRTVTCHARVALDADSTTDEPGVMRYVVPSVVTEEDLEAEREAEAEALAGLRARKASAAAE